MNEPTNETEREKWLANELRLMLLRAQKAEAKLEGMQCRFVRISDIGFIAVSRIAEIFVSAEFKTLIHTTTNETVEVKDPYAEGVRNLLP